MKKNPLPLFLLALLIFSCSKKDTDTSTTPLPDENEDPVRIEKVIHRDFNPNSQQLDTAVYTYEYDDSGRVTKRTIDGSFYEEYTYTDGKITAITSGPGSASSMNSALNYSIYSADGDTIFMDFSRPNSNGTGTDTTQLTYVYKDGYVTEFWTYLHFYETDFLHLQKEFYVYNNEGNLSESFMSTLVNPRQSSITVYEWDDKVNPKHGQPKLNTMLLYSGIPLESSSVHNPTMYQDSGGHTHTVKMTYNNDGYPLTVQFDSENFIRSEIFYNR
jgi:hypothetical protein